MNCNLIGTGIAVILLTCSACASTTVKPLSGLHNKLESSLNNEQNSNLRDIKLKAFASCSLPPPKSLKQSLTQNVPAPPSSHSLQVVKNDLSTLLKGGLPNEFDTLMNDLMDPSQDRLGIDLLVKQDGLKAVAKMFNQIQSDTVLQNLIHQQTAGASDLEKLEPISKSISEEIGVSTRSHTHRKGSDLAENTHVGFSVSRPALVRDIGFQF